MECKNNMILLLTVLNSPQETTYQGSLNQGFESFLSHLAFALTAPFISILAICGPFRQPGYLG
jgi:hypothetical protein